MPLAGKWSFLYLTMPQLSSLSTVPQCNHSASRVLSIQIDLWALYISSSQFDSPSIKTSPSMPWIVPCARIITSNQVPDQDLIYSFLNDSSGPITSRLVGIALSDPSAAADVLIQQRIDEKLEQINKLILDFDSAFNQRNEQPPAN
jgi:hypothetical protein